MGRLPPVSFAGSLSVHLALLLTILALRSAREMPRASDSTARTDARLVFFTDPRPAHGGGGSGARRTEPLRRAEARGADPLTAPAAAPPNISPQPVSLTMELEAPVISAVPVFANIDTATGAIDHRLPPGGSRGPGVGDVAGSGRGPGNGDGDGPGLGPGGGGNTGGDVYDVGGGVTAPIAVKQVRPQYTAAAMTARLAGSVIVQCVVMPDGTVQNARVIRSLDARAGLDQEALEAAREWRFRPGTLHGRPVAVRVTIELSFSIY